MQPKPVRVPDLKEAKRRGEKIAVLTAYDATMARLLDRAGVDVLLVGDTVGVVVLGYENTLPVTLDEMLPIRARSHEALGGRSSSPTCPFSPTRSVPPKRCGTPADC